ncbi:DNA recombination protein RmuC [Actinomadura sp. 6N118]|uniref:DNA recombination protein RmuC n=1 Tax=Actinomadura sp. 6N118 TaxID=3375151 RepID=UPI0037992DE2
MNSVTTATILLLASVVSCALGYLIARVRLNADRDRWREEQSRLQTALKLAEEQRDQARTQYSDVRAERDDVRESLRKREAAWTEQTAKLQTATEHIGQLNAELKSVREKYQRAEADLELLKESLETSRRQVYEKETALDRAGKVEAELRGSITEKDRLINDHTTNLEKLRTERATLEKQRAEVAAAQKQLQQLRDEQSRLQAEQIEAAVAKMLSTSQEKLAATADDKLGTATRAVTEKLRELEQHIREFDTKRTSTESRLDEQIRQLTAENLRSREQTEALVEALRKPQVRGQWGEMQLKRAFELANMREHCDYDLQVHVTGDGSIRRPDAVIHMTGGRNIVIDAKVSLKAFLEALEAADDAERDRLLREHARQVRRHVDSLAAKEYFEKVAGSPEFVLMFLPSEALLQAVLDKDPGLYEYAFKRRIVIASPTVLLPMLRTIELAWAEAAMKEHAEQVRRLGLEIYKRLGTLSGHLDKLGRSLDTSVKHYNAAIGSMERNVLPAARRFKELKVVTEDVKYLETVDSTTRALKAPELLQADGGDASVVPLEASNDEPESA